MPLPIQVDPNDPFIDIHTGRGQGSCTFANGFSCVCSCAGIAHAQLLRMVLTPGDFGSLPSKYQQALSQKIQKAQIDITNLSCDKITDIIQIKKQPTRIFFLSEEVTHPIVEHCRVIDILNWAKEDSNFTVCQQITSLCTYIQHHGIEVFKNLSPRAGGYLSQSHVLCDIVASIAFTLDNVPPTLDNIPPEVHLIKETFIDACKKTFASSRQTSYGFGPSQNKHKANAIVIRGTRRDSDIKESHEPIY